jgi:signal peptidase I
MRLLRFCLSLIVCAILLFLLVQAAFSFLVVDGPSMEPTLGDGQLIMVFRLAYGFKWGSAYALRWASPRRGDLLVFKNPQDGIPVVKRCLALPGDALSLTAEGLYSGGRVLPVDSAQAFHFLSGYTVPAGCLFMAGDNPAESVDSRDYGCVPIEKIEGKVLGFR